jgi:hypothetical protein
MTRDEPDSDGHRARRRATTDHTADSSGPEPDEATGDGAVALTRRSLLAGATGALLTAGVGTAGAATGQVGTGDRPADRAFAAELNGPITGDAAVTDLLGDGLGVDDGGLSAADARLTVTDGETTVEGVEAITFDGAFSVAGDSSGVTVDR